MRVPRWVFTVVQGVIAAGLAAVVVVVATSAWLLARYRPSAPGVDPTLLDPTVRSISSWSEVHQAALLVLMALLVLVLVSVPVVVVDPGRGPGRAIGAGLVALVGGAGASVAALTTAALAWDQVALREVTTGSDVQGWWLAAFDDRVLFVLVDGAEVSSRTYAVVLVVHLVAPVVAGAALVALGVLVGAARRRSAALAHTATPR